MCLRAGQEWASATFASNSSKIPSDVPAVGHAPGWASIQPNWPSALRTKTMR